MTELVRIEMTNESLSHIVTQAMFLGQVQYMTMIEPERDRMKQREAKRYLQRRGYEPKVLDEWVDMGLISRRKDGDGNSPVYYSLKEIQRQITVTEMKKGRITQILLEPTKKKEQTKRKTKKQSNERIQRLEPVPEDTGGV